MSPNILSTAEREPNLLHAGHSILLVGRWAMNVV